MEGEFEKTVVIGKSAKPRCFKNTNMQTLPVTYKAQNKAWMTSDIFLDWVKAFNERMRRQQRKVILFLDNAPAHPPATDDLANVKCIFLPANTTSVLQPLDQGIIAMVKGRYRKRLLQRALTTMEKGEDISKLNKCVTVKDACSWIASSVKEVPASTVRKCFAMCGITHEVLTSTPEVAQVDEEDIPLAQLVDRDDEIPLAQLAATARTQLGLADVMATAEEVSSFDNELPTCTSSSGSAEADIIAANKPSEDADSVPSDVEDLALEESEDEDSSAPPALTSRQMLDSLRAIISNGRVSDEILSLVSQAEHLLSDDVLRGKIAGRQQTIAEMFGQRQ